MAGVGAMPYIHRNSYTFFTAKFTGLHKANTTNLKLPTYPIPYTVYPIPYTIYPNTKLYTLSNNN